jgi:ubiquitin carboxyl-terminal hydrolase L3
MSMSNDHSVVTTSDTISSPVTAPAGGIADIAVTNVAAAASTDAATASTSATGSATATTAEVAKDSWRAIESNPQVFTKLLRSLVSPDWSMVDVFSFEDEYLQYIPQPVLAFSVLSPMAEDVPFQTVAENERRDAFFIRQGSSLPNACGTIALVHAIVNNRHNLGLPRTGAIADFVQQCAQKTPEQIGDIMAEFAPIRDLHNELVNEGQTAAAASNADDVASHYVCLIPVGRDVVELDGAFLSHPRRVDTMADGESFTVAAIRVIRAKGREGVRGGGCVLMVVCTDASIARQSDVQCDCIGSKAT